MTREVLSMKTKLPSHNENRLDETLLRGNDEDYFIKRMKKQNADNFEAGWYSKAKPVHYSPYPINNDTEGIA